MGQIGENWEMKCPNCGSDESLDIRATVSVRLTADGTDGDECFDGHEWDGASACRCASCQWSGKVADAQRHWQMTAGQHVFTFDVKLFATLQIGASNEYEARGKLALYLNGAEANFGADEKGDPLLSEVALDTEDGGDLVEIDGEAV